MAFTLPPSAVIPSELSRVVLSQTGTFRIHRVQNSYDLDYVRRNIPSISNGQVMRLSRIRPGNRDRAGKLHYGAP